MEEKEDSVETTENSRVVSALIRRVLIDDFLRSGHAIPKKNIPGVWTTPEFISDECINQIIAICRIVYGHSETDYKVKYAMELLRSKCSRVNSWLLTINKW